MRVRRFKGISGAFCSAGREIPIAARKRASKRPQGQKRTPGNDRVSETIGFVNTTFILSANADKMFSTIFSSLSRNVSNNAFIFHHVLLYGLSHIFTNEYCPHVIPFYYLIKGCGVFTVCDYRINSL